MRKIFLTAAAALALLAPLSAQNINQSVQVTNDYVTRFADFQKQGATMQIPDTLYRFDYNFDYSVFDTPYKGSYEFSPYQILVTPEKRTYDGSDFYLRAGAGYTIHPQLELAWQALRREDLTLGVFADAGGYLGPYRRDKSGDPFAGHDLWGRAGLGGQYLMPAVRLSWQLGYEGIYAGEDIQTPFFKSGLNAASVSTRVQSRERPGDYLFYDVSLRYRYADERYEPVLNRPALGEHALGLGVSGGPVLDSKYRILLDAFFEMDMIKEAASSPRKFTANLVALRPHVDFLLGPVHLDAGARLDYGECGDGGKFTVSPAVTASLDLLDQDLTLFAAVSGGQSLQGRYDTKQVNHFSYHPGEGAFLSREKIRARIGLDGHWRSRLQYGLEAGYASYASLPLSYFSAVSLVDFQTIYAKGKFAWSDERVQVDGALGYAYLMAPEQFALAPPAFTADVRGSYNWQRRVYVGAFVEAATSRRGLAAGMDPVPGYADFGLTGEYRLNRRLGFWAEGGNLLGMDIERLPGYIERGPRFTVGLSVKL
jgi:hypothetical protein